MSDCLFCKMVTGEEKTDKVYEDDRLFVIRDIYPKAKTHLLVIPKLHLASLAQAKEEHAPLLGYILVSLNNFAQAQGLNSFKTVINTGHESGQVIFHLHFHLLGNPAVQLNEKEEGS